MKGEKLQKLSLNANLFNIPIEKYEKDMSTELSKEKKDEILKLFTNFNNLRSEYDFEKIETELHEACQRYDLELIKILLSETIQNDSKELTFKIDKTNKTASLFRVRLSKRNQLIIPRTVKDGSNEYLITSFCGTNSFNKIIKFVEDSVVQTIYGNAFSYSYVEEIYFPASLKELKEGWCKDVNNLKKIKISPLNGQFKIKDDKYLLGKSDQNKEEFDILYFAYRDIKQANIPSNIKIISSYAFDNCPNLENVEFEPNSNLQIIKSYAFYDCSKIEEVFIPSTVTKICEGAFYFCHNLRKFEIPQNSNLKTIESKVFLRINMKDIYFPSSLEELKEGWCNETSKLTKITISPLNSQFKIKDDKYLLGKSDKNKDEFDILLFANRDIKQANIPSNIKIISSYAFDNCKKLAKVEIPTNSNLQTIKKYAFYNCSNLKKVKISKNSNLQAIESYAFNSSQIEDFFIPSKVSRICQYSFSNCPKIRKVEIPINSEIEIIESNAFFWSKVNEIFIPAKVLKICESAFSNCSYLRRVEIPTNSNLQIIESDAFLWTKISELFIPAKVSKICKNAFSSCFCLHIIEISEESILESFPLSAFPGCPNALIMIPSSLKRMIHSNEPV